MEKTQSIRCRTEFAPLKEVIVCPANHLHIGKPINRAEKQYADENIDKVVATEEHEKLVEALKEAGVRVYEIPAEEQFPEQVFMRDTGFVIDDTFYIARLKSNVRQGEEQVLAIFAAEHDKPFEHLSIGTIEGGDVVLAEDRVYVGASGRTSKDSLKPLEANHPEIEFEWIEIDDEYLHLDCVFNPISENEALVYREAIAPSDITRLEERYTLIDVSKEEQFHLGVNVFSIGEKTVIALPINKETNAKLRAVGYNVIEVPFSEIIKSGGGFRCVTLPLLRSE
ncbi:dimethylarginine dimethylaminohydrolase family protein [Shouchella shacheensis]|uniref:dimethylarginine dimethylaminohydrolase family protein n=1 Tax=Shouchella shacheensis TaxID=1649580 RepID=UPI00073FB7E6|nr:arginine deiminase family protein [Shouchella shacheensis]